ncbi:MAG: hypothetical protein NTU57_00335 [Candidatus Aenigmarchaeota archaeon]|nr:hypothetical protein [Candidatus Aenigmarchaeota archaeon]
MSKKFNAVEISSDFRKQIDGEISWIEKSCNDYKYFRQFIIISYIDIDLFVEKTLIIFFNWLQENVRYAKAGSKEESLLFKVSNFHLGGLFLDAINGKKLHSKMEILEKYLSKESKTDFKNFRKNVNIIRDLRNQAAHGLVTEDMIKFKGENVRMNMEVFEEIKSLVIGTIKLLEDIEIDPYMDNKNFMKKLFQIKTSM